MSSVADQPKRLATASSSSQRAVEKCRRTCAHQTLKKLKPIKFCFHRMDRGEINVHSCKGFMEGCAPGARRPARIARPFLIMRTAASASSSVSAVKSSTSHLRWGPERIIDRSGPISASWPTAVTEHPD